MSSLLFNLYHSTRMNKSRYAPTYFFWKAGKKIFQRDRGNMYFHSLKPLTFLQSEENTLRTVHNIRYFE